MLSGDGNVLHMVKSSVVSLNGAKENGDVHPRI